jgi:hypothetical protein
VFATRQFLQTMLHTLLGIVANRARVQQNNIRIGYIVGQLSIGGLQNGSYHFTIRHVHLAAVGFDIELLHCHPLFFRVQSYNKMLKAISFCLIFAAP